MIIILTTRRLRQLLRRSYCRGYDEGMTTGYRLGLSMRTLENRDREALTPRVLRELDDIAKDGGL